jgi:hypothetical protein
MACLSGNAMKSISYFALFCPKLHVFGFILGLLVSLETGYCANLLKNGTFEGEPDHWNLKIRGQVAATCDSVSDNGPSNKGALKIDITLPGKSNYLELSQPLKLAKGVTYHLKGWAKMGGSKKASVFFRPKGNPLAVRGKKTEIEGSGDWAEFTHIYKHETDEPLELVITEMASKEGVYWFSELAVYAEADVPKPAETEASNKSAGEHAPLADATPITQEGGERTVARKDEIVAGRESGSPAAETAIPEGYTVVKVDPVMSTIVVLNLKSNSEEVYNLSQQTRVILNGADAAVTDALPGMKVKVVPAADPIFAESIELTRE